jgi:hypothetical protein
VADSAANARPKQRYLRYEAPKQARLKAYVQSELLAAQAQAARHLRTLADGTNPEAKEPAKMMSTRTKAALVLAQGSMAAERAKDMSQAPRVFGVVMMQPRIEDPRQWEAMAAAGGEPKAIEAVATPVEKKP